MQDKFTIEELMIRVMPGGFLLAVVFFIFSDSIQLNINDNLDFLYTFFFFCSAFIIGELLQTLAHEFEWIIDIFFKFRRPSKIFLYQNNPVVSSNYKRKELLKYLKLSKEDLKIFDKDYSDIPMFFGRKKENDNLSQSIFWKLYSEVSNTNEIKISNRNYLFVRVIMIEFLLLSILFFLSKNLSFGTISIVIFLLFLWRGRGVARGLVFKTVLLNLKKK